LKGIPYQNGGGFKVLWGGDRIIQFHPNPKGNHHGGQAIGGYWKVSSGQTGPIRFDFEGNKLID